MYNRVVRLRGSEKYEPAAKTSIGYELDPEHNLGFTLVVRSYVVAEDYSFDEFVALVKSETAKRDEERRFRAAFSLDSRDLTDDAS